MGLHKAKRDMGGKKGSKDEGEDYGEYLFRKISP